MINNKNNKVYFIHIPKTAGTSLEDIVYKAGHTSKNHKNNKYIIGTGFFKKYISRQKNYYQKYLQPKYYQILIKNQKINWKMVFYHIPMSFWKHELLLKYKSEFIIFCVKRNPYSRFVSDFKFWIKFYKETRSNKNLNLYFYHLLEHVKDVYDNNFSETTNNLNRMVKKLLSSKKYYYSLDGHLIPQYEFIYANINGITIQIPNYILRFEELHHDFILFKKKYLQLISNNALNKTKLHSTSKEITIKNLSLQSKKLIYQYYRKDFELLNYSH